MPYAIHVILFQYDSSKQVYKYGFGVLLNGTLRCFRNFLFELKIDV